MKEAPAVVTGKSGHIRLAVVLPILWLPALLFPEAVTAAARLYPLAASPNPYFVLSHAGLLYLAAPAVAISACILFLSPGLLLSAAAGACDSAADWVVSALAIGIAGNSLLAGLLQAILGRPLRGQAFGIAIACGSVLCIAWLLWKSRRPGLRLPWADSRSRAMLFSMLATAWLLLAALTPKFYWENFNGDGIHAFESARLLLAQPLPFWPPSSGEIAGFPGFTSMLFAFPTSWFIRLFGEIEVAARLPILLYLAALFGGLASVIEFGGGRRLGIAEHVLLWLGLAVYVVVMAFSATYEPYSADLALPVTQDTLLMVCFLGFALAFLKGRIAWMAGFTALTWVSLPNGPLLLGLWLAGVLLLFRPRPWKQAGLAACAMAGCAALGGLLPAILAGLGMPGPGSEYAGEGLLERLINVQWGDWRRFLFAIVPGGVLPALSLLAWRRQDAVARVLTFVTAGAFGLFYIQAWVALHHFVPAMILPLAVFWRGHPPLDPRRRVGLLAATAAAGVAALWISLPRSARPFQEGRLVGAAIEDRTTGYDLSDPQAFHSTILLREILPVGWDPAVPEHSFGGSSLVWNYYAHHRDAQGIGDYLVQPLPEAAPPGARLLASTSETALYVRSETALRTHRALRPPAPAGSRIYWIPKWMLFHGPAPPGGGVRIGNLRDWLKARMTK